MWLHIAATLLKVQCSVKSKILIITRILSKYIATFSAKGTIVGWGRSTHLLFTISGMQLDSKGYSHHLAVVLWLLYYRCGYCYRLFMCLCVLWVLLCFVWKWSFSFYLCVHPKIFKNELMNHWGLGFGMLWPEYVELLLFKTGKNKTWMLSDLNQTMQYSTPESWIPCDTEVQLLCPSKPILGPRLGELVLHGCPRILYPDQLSFTAFPRAPSPPPAVYRGQVVGCFGL